MIGGRYDFLMAQQEQKGPRLQVCGAKRTEMAIHCLGPKQDKRVGAWCFDKRMLRASRKRRRKRYRLRPVRRCDEVHFRCREWSRRDLQRMPACKLAARRVPRSYT